MPGVSLNVCTISFWRSFDTSFIHLRCECWWRTPCAIHNFILFDLDSWIVQHSPRNLQQFSQLGVYLCFIDNWTVQLNKNGDSKYFSTPEVTKVNVMNCVLPTSPVTGLSLKGQKCQLWHRTIKGCLTLSYCSVPVWVREQAMHSLNKYYHAPLNVPKHTLARAGQDRSYLNKPEVTALYAAFKP